MLVHALGEALGKAGGTLVRGARAKSLRMDGTRCVGVEIERRWPERARRVVFVTGDTLTSTLREFAAQSGRPVIEKPFLPDDVRRVVAEMAQHGERAARC